MPLNNPARSHKLLLSRPSILDASSHLVKVRGEPPAGNPFHNVMAQVGVFIC